VSILGAGWLACRLGWTAFRCCFHHLDVCVCVCACVRACVRVRARQLHSILVLLGDCTSLGCAVVWALVVSASSDVLHPLRWPPQFEWIHTAVLLEFVVMTGVVDWVGWYGGFERSWSAMPSFLTNSLYTFYVFTSAPLLLLTRMHQHSRYCAATLQKSPFVSHHTAPSRIFLCSPALPGPAVPLLLGPGSTSH
jgi:hypothetical protein